MKFKKIFFILIFVASIFTVYGKNNVSVKTNLLYDAGANVNVGAELRLAKKWSIDLSVDFNDWTIKEHKWKHWFVQPEGRYWFCDAFAKHFVGFHAIGGQYNIGNLDTKISFLGSDFSKLNGHRYQGWGLGAGLAYGYALPLHRNWNLEFEIGVGYVYFNYDVFECRNCGKKTGSGHHNYVGPTKAALNLVYIF
ncbi:MAG: DUF3575 domain-containing protein [Muribaculaceae bacterium]|nr:DUF3575 domain-containing protein [Muribaculaceae bacterium]